MMQSFIDAVVNTFMIEKKKMLLPPPKKKKKKKKICMFAPFTRHLHGMQIDANIYKFKSFGVQISYYLLIFFNIK